MLCLTQFPIYPFQQTIALSANETGETMSICPTPIRVALPVPIPHCFDYLPPDTGITPSEMIGCRIRVLFGKRELVGLVVGEGGEDATQRQLRPALAWIDHQPLLTGELASSVHWLARYTHTPLGEMLALALPSKFRHGAALPETRVAVWQLTPKGRVEQNRLRANSRPEQVTRLLESEEGCLEEQLKIACPGWRSATRALLRKGYVQRTFEPPPRWCDKTQTGPALNQEQQTAVSAVKQSVGFQPFLLHGVTGSGKTEVYLHLIAHCLAMNRQALLLVPEIGLTPQTLERIQRRLNAPVHVLHSQLSDSERARAWAAAWRGHARLIVGTRSAIFTPLPQAGLIIIDEEHDSSYKQQDGPRYHARDFALVRAKALNIPILLGSATPSLESLLNARTSRYHYLQLKHRAGKAQPPQVRIIDMRKRAIKDGLCAEVINGIGAALAHGEQVLVFKNRRGYAPALLCHDCGWTAVCPRCSTDNRQTPLTLSTRAQRLQCHHCGASTSIPAACPNCTSLSLQPQGVGTERLEQCLTESFPDHCVVRIDRDSTTKRNSVSQQLTRLGQSPGIIVGTQLLAKGHDLPLLTRVIVVGIDEGLFSADFRATEKLSQLLIQVAGRAGRSQRPGEVWLQTHHPNHPLLNTLIHGGYDTYSETELCQREAAEFPPWTHLALIRAEAKTDTAINAFLNDVKALMPSHTTVFCYGPMPAPMPRRAGFHRSQLMFVASTRSNLHHLLNMVVPAIYELPMARRVRWSVDIDPIDLY